MDRELVLEIVMLNDTRAASDLKGVCRRTFNVWRIINDDPEKAWEMFKYFCKNHIRSLHGPTLTKVYGKAVVLALRLYYPKLSKRVTPKWTEKHDRSGTMFELELEHNHTTVRLIDTVVQVLKYGDKWASWVKIPCVHTYVPLSSIHPTVFNLHHRELLLINGIVGECIDQRKDEYDAIMEKLCD